MAFSDKNQTDDELTITYHHPSWKEGSFWRFAKFRTLEDTEETQHLQEVIEKENPTTAQVQAFLARHSRGWGGPDNTLPDSFKDENGQPHALRGQVPPDTLEWIKKQDGDVIMGAVEFLSDAYSLRSKEEQDSFRTGDRSVSGEGSAIERKEEVRLSASTS